MRPKVHYAQPPECFLAQLTPIRIDRDRGFGAPLDSRSQDALAIRQTEWHGNGYVGKVLAMPWTSSEGRVHLMKIGIFNWGLLPAMSMLL